MQRGGKVSKLIVVLLFCLPATAFADAGTPLMWAGMLHLVFGNALIGVLEGLLLAWLFQLGRWKCVGVMIAANYFSAWFGDAFVMGYAFRNPNLNLYNAWRWAWMMVGVTFLLTCVLEWPFVFFCLRKSDHRFKKSIWGNLLVQTVSYVLLSGWYWCASARSLYTEAHIVKPVAFPVPTNSILYFVSTNKSVYSLNLPDGASRKVSELPKNVQSGDLHDWDVERIGIASNSVWEFHTGYWPYEGISGKNNQTGERLWLAFETPFAVWNIGHGYQLPGDCVVFQLGEDQICILDPKTRRVALIARGHDPVVVLEGEK